MPSLPGSVELVEIASIAHKNGQHVCVLAPNADFMHPYPSPLSQVDWEATPSRMGIVCRSVAAVAAVAVETVAPDR